MPELKQSSTVDQHSFAFRKHDQQAVALPNIDGGEFQSAGVTGHTAVLAAKAISRTKARTRGCRRNSPGSG